MRRTTSTSAIFPKRLREARLRSGLSQEQLGIEAGIDEFSASARVNQYETGKHTPKLQTAHHLAEVLHVPTAFLYEGNDLLARLLIVAAPLPLKSMEALLEYAERMSQASASPETK
ncbi:MAG: helix-turn-helix transcriptional regulator [Burkholderia sp.]|jgi:transcriptional regulator with XRE-family HTH domain|uniref:helix-turn-helix domain-containing protein n=1 Tax=Burkholderiaceae TaxID=119060 RepID=UPI001CA3AB65|nr:MULTISPECIES: helix-turn-helix transcriptional regulator [Burkholderiaceae]MCA3640375.1 helix-turn-helix transcriptional regulator [Methylobacterium sp.]MCA3774600.1 helix-turn-helix transcriptional regulator [Cutibacterium sp.]MBY8605969.1 helix-turn-helix domain-containing protein [Burkholderia arboris]MCA3199439.1 helix-turn-helix transcriptional regulator [Cupriavidus sp.]MCA3779110.1 helix-turn-helix transcriptional regulator [Burkholderia sp.]